MGAEISSYVPGYAEHFRAGMWIPLLDLPANQSDLPTDHPLHNRWSEEWAQFYELFKFPDRAEFADFLSRFQDPAVSAELDRSRFTPVVIRGAFTALMQDFMAMGGLGNIPTPEASFRLLQACQPLFLQSHQMNLLWLAVKLEDIETISALVRKWPDLLDRQTEFVGESIFHFAMTVKSGMSLTALIESSRDRDLEWKKRTVMQLNTDRNSLIHLAAGSDFVDGIVILQEWIGDDSELRDWFSNSFLIPGSKGRILLHSTAENGSVEMLDFLLAQSNSETMLIQTDVENNSPFHLAVAMGSVAGAVRIWRECERTLSSEIGEEFLLGTNRSDRFSILHFAAKNSDPAMLRWLLSLNPNLDAVTASGLTLVHIAAEHGNDAVISALVEMGGCDLHQPTPKGVTPLHLAAKKDHASTIRLLVQLGARHIDARTAKGSTPFLRAVKNKSLKAIHALYQLGSQAMEWVLPKAGFPISTDTLNSEIEMTLLWLGVTRPERVDTPSEFSSEFLRVIDGIPPVDMSAERAAEYRNRFYFDPSLTQRLLMNLRDPVPYTGNPTPFSEEDLAAIAARLPPPGPIYPRNKGNSISLMPPSISREELEREVVLNPRVTIYHPPNPDQFQPTYEE